MILLNTSVFYQYFYDLAQLMGLPETYQSWFVGILLFITIIIISVLSYYLAKVILIRVVTIISKKTANKWDDALVERHFFRKLAFMVPAIILLFYFSWLFKDFPNVDHFFKVVLKVYLIIMTMIIINAFLNAVNDIYMTYDIAKTKTIKGYLQVAKIIFFTILSVFILSIIISKSANYILGGFGAATAVLLFIFRDPILGLIGSIQLSANDMIRPNDWIVMEKYGADGNVIDINLTTVKVQNWDKTITTIPTYSLVSDAFVNWRGMEDSDGRRIVRAINIDLNSIKFCTEEMLERFSKIKLIADYIKEKQAEIEAYNQSVLQENFDLSINFRKQTNIGVFRQYLLAYIQANPQINKAMTVQVRQLAPTSKGVPLQIYCFSKVKNWVEYEKIQSDIFDHIFSTVKDFDLKIFQQPTGEDMKLFVKNNELI